MLALLRNIPSTLRRGWKRVSRRIAEEQAANRARRERHVPGPRLAIGERKRIRGCIVRVVGALNETVAVELLEDPLPDAFRTGAQFFLDGWWYRVVGWDRGRRALLRCVGTTKEKEEG